MARSSTTALPFVDEHATVIAADTERVWAAVLETVDRMASGPGAAGYARLVGCTDRQATGPRPVAVGSTIPGFHVDALVPGESIVLAGGHRFSSYALAFRLEAAEGGGTRLRAETRAVFPGLAGGVYRFLVIGTRGHVVGVRRLLATVKRRAERGLSR